MAATEGLAMNNKHWIELAVALEEFHRLDKLLCVMSVSDAKRLLRERIPKNIRDLHVRAGNDACYSFGG